VLNEKVKRNGEGLSYGSVCDYVRGLVFEAKKMHGGSGSGHADFFTCLNVGDQGWLKQMLYNAQRCILKRCLLAGEPMSSQASAIFRDTLIEISRELARMDTDDTITRRLV